MCKRKKSAWLILSPRTSAQFHLTLHLPDGGRRREVRSYAGEVIEGVGCGGGVKGISSLAHLAEVCSLVCYKNPCKRERGGSGEQKVRGAFKGGGARGLG